MQRVTDLFETPILYTETYIHDVFCMKTHQIYNSKRKSVSQGSISKNLFGKLANLFESSYIKRPAVRKHAARHRPVRNDKDSIRKSTNIKKS